jgi:uncharacterized protein YecT (DUF1311 family)
MATHGAILILCCTLGILRSGFGQEASPETKKALTPEMQAFRQQMKQFEAERLRLQAIAQKAFDSEMALEKAGDCPDAGSTYDDCVCYNKVLETADQNLAKYVGAIRYMLSLRAPDVPGLPARYPGPDGMPTTSAENVSEFDRLEQAWRPYREAACTAHHHQYGGGSGGPGAELECRVRLTRGHMKDLDSIYLMLLHK